MMQESQMINTNDIFSHPDNPRKDIGDIEELKDSIQKNGILQNLTVIPATDCHHAPPMAKYILLIGHRRFAAATAAGITEVPCKVIKGLSAKEQVGIMLEENMQRSDLTVLEQANGFQMMLDLGDTVDNIAQKTGFSKTTVYHRVNIAKLDREKVEEAINNYQLTITDFIELEKLDDIEKRNEVLENVRDSANLKYRVEQEIKRIEREKQRDAFEQRLQAAGYTAPPEEYEKNKWSNKYERKYIRPEEYETYELNDGYNWYTLDEYSCYLIREKKEVQKELTPEELKKKEKDEYYQAIRESNGAIKAGLKTKICDFIKNMIVESEVDKQDIDVLWGILTKLGEYVAREEILSAIDEIFETEDEESEETLENLSTIKQMLCVVYQNIMTIINQMSKASYSWENTGKLIMYSQESAEVLKYIIDYSLTPQGFELTEKETEYINGTHSIYSEEKR